MAHFDRRRKLFSSPSMYFLPTHAKIRSILALKLYEDTAVQEPSKALFLNISMPKFHYKLTVEVVKRQGSIEIIILLCFFITEVTLCVQSFLRVPYIQRIIRS